MSFLRCVAVAAIVVATSSRSYAQNVEAEALFSEGNKLMEQNKVAEACTAFEGSNRLETRAGTLIRIGECREQNHELASAWSAYKDALTRVKDQHKRQYAQTKIAQIEPRLSYLLVSVSDEARVDGLVLSRNGEALDTVLWNRMVPINGGTYIIAGRAPGHEVWQTNVTIAVEGARITVEVPKFKDLTKLAPPPPPSAVVPSSALEQEADEPTPHTPRPLFTTRRKFAIAAGGLAVAALATGVVLGLQANSRESQARSLCPDPAMCAQPELADSLNATAHGRAIYADVGFAVAAGSAIAAGVLWFTGGSQERSHRLAIAPHISAGHVGLAIVGGF